jgi:hypothetical protein
MPPTSSPAQPGNVSQPSSRFSSVNIFKRNYEKYDGVPLVNIYLLNLLFTLMFLFLSYSSWAHIFQHTGPWDSANSAAWFMWGSCSVISFIGIRRPLKMLPIVLFEIVYKTAWLIVVALPLYQRHELAASPNAGMANVFILVILPIVAMPWRYFFRTFIVDKQVADAKFIAVKQ